MPSPRVSVVMAVHNGLPYLQPALDSILSQAFTGYELIVVDDASTDGSAKVLANIRDEHLRLITNERNLGLTKSLNKALEIAHGEYIARMDHDDLSLPLRLSQQVEFLDAYPEIDVLGTWARTLGAEPEQTWRYPLYDDEIRSELLFHSVLVHSSVMWRRFTFERHDLRYAPEIARAQDYDLWVRAAPHVRFANLDRVLLHYRIHADQIGAQYGEEQQEVATQVRLRQLLALGLAPNPGELHLHNQISQWQFPADVAGLQAVEAWLLQLRDANRDTGMYPRAAFNVVLERLWWAACTGAMHLGREAWRLYRRSPLVRMARRGLLPRARFFLKSALAPKRDLDD